MNNERCQNSCQFRLPKATIPHSEKGGKKKHSLLIYQGNNIMYYMQKQSHLSRYMISQYIKIQVDFDWFLVNKHEK